MADEMRENRQPAITARDLLHSAAIMVGTLLADLPAERRELLNDCVAHQGELHPDAERLQRASEAILREVDQPWSVVDVC